jgi:hypothetical protein
LIFAIIAFLEGVLYAPAYYDALAYRLPRVLHWLAEGRWHWIHTSFQRVNTRGCGAEWLSAPVIALLKTDRPLFLFNFVSFCLLPGLIFSSFRRIGVKRRVAYAWMWLLPLGSCFLLQASDIGNDLLAVTLILAAFAYALKARQEGQVRDLWISALAVALATGVKATALPLVLVWAVVIAPCWRLWIRHIGGTISVGLIAAAVSFLPAAYFNWRASGDWSGSKLEGLPFETPNSWARVVGNVEVTLAQNLQPPIAPFANAWNQSIAPKLTPSRLQDAIGQNLQMVKGHPLAIEQLQTDASGLGLQTWVLLIGSTAAAMIVSRRRKSRSSKTVNWTQRTVMLAAVIAYFALFKTSFVRSIARLAAPGYAFLAIPFLLHRGHEIVVRKFGFRLAVLAFACLTAIPLLIQPERPLLPMRQILHRFQDKAWARRAETVYKVFGERSDAFNSVIAALPVDAQVLGFVTFDDPEGSLWKPYGSRQVVHVCPGDTAEDLRARGLKYVLVGSLSFQHIFPDRQFEDWLREMNGRVIQTIPLQLRAGAPPALWILIELR